MRIEQNYCLDPRQAISGIEDLAESFMDPRYKGYTIRGITFGKSRDSNKLLVPIRYRTPRIYQAATGTNYPTFRSLLDAAKEIKKRGTFSDFLEPPERFNFRELVKHNLQEGEGVTTALEQFGVLGRDDLCWFFWLRYNQGNLSCAVGDNSKWNGQDERFQALYERFFGKYFKR